MVIDRAVQDKKNTSNGQTSIFATFEEVAEAVNSVEYPDIKEFNKETLLKQEKEYVGIYLSGHPLDDYLDKFESFNFKSSMIRKEDSDNFSKEDGDDEEMGEATYYGEEIMPEDVGESKEEFVKDGQNVIGGGVVTSVKKLSGKNMAILTIEDLDGTFDAFVFPKIYNKYNDLIVEDTLLTVRGHVSIRDGKSPVVVVDSMTPWKKGEDVAIKEEKLYLRFDTKDIDVYTKVKDIISSYPGKSPVVIKCSSTNNAFAFSARVELNNYLSNELIGLLGESNVILR